MATSKFIKYFQTVAGAPVTGANIWLVPQANTYPTDALQLTEHGTRDGVYYRENVEDGEYKLYIDAAGGSSPSLYEEKIWVGENRLTLIGDRFNSSLELQTAGIEDDAVTSDKLADNAVTANKISSAALGGGLNRALEGKIEVQPDGATLELAIDYSVQVKDGGISSAKIANDAVDKNKIAADVAGSGLGQNADGSLEVKTDGSTLEINSDILRVKDSGITAAKLGTAAVTNTKIEDGAITPTKLDADAVTTAKISSAAVTPAKLAAQTKTVTNTTSPTPDYIGQPGRDSSGKTYVAIALTGTMWEEVIKNDASTLETTAAGLVRVKDSGITTAKINNSAVNSDKLASDSVITAKILNKNVTEPKLADYLQNLLTEMENNHEWAIEFNGTDEYLTKASPTNILTNGTFETGSNTDSWTTAGTVLFNDTETGKTGNYCCKITYSGGGSIYKTTFLTASKKYKMTVRYKSTSELRIGLPVTGNGYKQLPVTSQWNTAIFTFTADASNTGLSFNIASGIVWIDDISIKLDWKLDLNEEYELINHSVNRDFEQTLVSTYQSNFSSGVDGFGGSEGTLTGNIDSIGGVNDTLRFYASNVETLHYFDKNILSIGKKYRIRFDYYIPSANTNVGGLIVTEEDGDTIMTIANASAAKDIWNAVETEKLIIYSGVLRFKLLNKSDSATFAGANSITDDLVYIKNVSIYEIPNMVSNGTFTADSQWTTGTGWAISGGEGVKTAGTASALSQAINSVNGKKYRIAFCVKNYSSGSIYAYANGAQTGAAKTGNGIHTLDFTSSSNDLNYGVYADDTFGGSIDNIHIYELPDWVGNGNHSYDCSIVDKYSGNMSGKLTSSGTGDASNCLSLASQNFQTLVSGNKFTLEGFAKLDASSLNYTTEKITNSADRELSSDSGFWNKDTGVTIADGVVKFNNVNSGLGVYRNGLLTANKVYKVQFEIKNYSSGILKFVAGNNVISGFSGNGIKIAYVLCGTGSAGLFDIYADGSGVTLEVDNISVLEANLQPIITTVLGGKLLTSAVLNPNSWTKFVLNFEATASEVNQILKMYINGDASVFFENISLTLAYDAFFAFKINNTTSVNPSDRELIISWGDVSGNTDNIRYARNESAIEFIRLGNSTDNVDFAYVGKTPSTNFSTWYSVGYFLNRTAYGKFYLNGVINNHSSDSKALVLGKAKNATFFNINGSSTYNSFCGIFGPIQIIRFDNIGQSNLDATTHLIGSFPTGGGADVVLYFNFKGDEIEWLNDKSANGNNLVGVQVDLLTNKKMKI